MSGENNDTLALFQNLVASKSAITIVSDKRITSIRECAFEYMSDLVSVEFPSVASVGDASFAFCSVLKNVSLPAVETMGNSVFRDTALETIELPSIATIGGLDFYNCSDLTRVVLSGDTVSTLSYVNTFYETPIYTSDDTGYIYVNPDLVDDYKTATNWSTYADKILAIGSVASSSSDARTSVEDNEFENDTDIYYFDFPACETVGDYAFSGCANLVGFSLGEWSSTLKIGDYAFYQCTNLCGGDYEVYNSVYLGKLTSIDDYAFAYAGSEYGGETTVHIDSVAKVATIGQYAFYYANAGLTCGILDMYTSTGGVSLTSIGAGAFYNVTVPNAFAFDQSSGLVFYTSSFQNTDAYSEDGYSLTLTGPCTFYAQAFYNSDLQYLYLTNEDEMSVMKVGDAFSGSRIDTGSGCIYVPESLYDDYCSDTNWCAYPIEVI